MLFVFVHENRCPTRLPYQMMGVSFISNATVSLVVRELPIPPEHLILHGLVNIL
jgi:hypothetical protein